VTGRDSIHDKIKAPMMRRSRLATAITSQTSERQIDADEQDLVLGGLHVSMMETGRSIRRLP
jgi:hypothetical protein